MKRGAIMRWIIGLSFAAHLMMAGTAWATPTIRPVTLDNPLVADISSNHIEIRSDFNGTQLLIFGARNAPGELVIIMRGPPVNATLRRKERIAGMWMYLDNQEYHDLPIFYALSSTKPLSQLAPPSALQALGLGENRMIRGGSVRSNPVFDKALADAFHAKRWWQSPFASISYFGESLFKARINLPDSLPSGHYTVEVYLFDRGKAVGVQTIPLQVSKTGFDANVANAARTQSLWYGIGAIFMALGGGWLAHRLFRRE